MANTVVVGAQWGDEAKGKIVDYLAASAAMVVRYGGGSNAGHTVVVDGATYKFHLVPCGILHPGVTCVIADGVVVDPKVLVTELEELQSRGHSVERLRISANAHVVMPYHHRLDDIAEKRRGAAAIGTTGRGIGPAYADKAARVGIRMHEFVDPQRFAQRARERIAENNLIFTRVYDEEPLDADAVIAEYSGYAERLKGFVTDTSVLVAKAAASEAGVVFEGAQGTLLDLDMGTYPFVTSSHPLAGGACVGTGIGPTAIHSVLGVAKSYTTRVGAGAFPTELKDAIGDTIRERGNEYGTTTGRPRRCGWLDTVILRYAARVNGLTGLCLGLLDVLTGLDTLRIAVAYRVGGRVLTDLPTDLGNRTDLTPVYEELPGWSEDISGARRLDELPPNARAYIRRVEELVEVPVVSVSVGPHREQTIVASDILMAR
ncbi:MAG: adenylosuccinate synthase [Chthonomonadales bacterium]